MPIFDFYEKDRLKFINNLCELTEQDNYYSTDMVPVLENKKMKYNGIVNIDEFVRYKDSNGLTPIQAYNNILKNNLAFAESLSLKLKDYDLYNIKNINIISKLKEETDLKVYIEKSNETSIYSSLLEVSLFADIQNNNDECTDFIINEANLGQIKTAFKFIKAGFKNPQFAQKLANDPAGAVSDGAMQYASKNKDEIAKKVGNWFNNISKASNNIINSKTPQQTIQTPQNNDQNQSTQSSQNSNQQQNNNSNINNSSENLNNDTESSSKSIGDVLSKYVGKDLIDAIKTGTLGDYTKDKLEKFIPSLNNALSKLQSSGLESKNKGLFSKIKNKIVTFVKKIKNFLIGNKNNNEEKKGDI